MFGLQKVDIHYTRLYTAVDTFMWIGVNNLQMRSVANLSVDKLSEFKKLYTYCPHEI